MKFDLLEKNIIDVLEEEQIKLGYIDETVRLYYPLQSLNLFLGTECTSEEMTSLLEEFISEKKEQFGEIQISEKKDRFCFLIPPEGAAYIHEHMSRNPFLHALVDAISVHGISFEDVFEVFRRFSYHVCIEKMDDEDYDYLVYFEDAAISSIIVIQKKTIRICLRRHKDPLPERAAFYAALMVYGGERRMDKDPVVLS